MLKKYMIFIAILTGISIVLGMSYSNFIVASENHKVAEMYIGTLKYSMTIDGTTKNTLSVPAGETIVDVSITNENPIDTYYKLIYQNNSNVSIKYYESTKDTNDNVTNYSSPNNKITSNNTNTIKLKIVNNSTSSQNITFKIVGGFATNTLEDVTVPSGYTIINTIETPSTNTYFCTTTDTLTQGLKYVNGQYTYAYKQEGTYASSGLAWNNISKNGWGVQLTDKTSTDAVTSKACTYINNKPITSMAYMFCNSQATTLDVSNFDTSNVTGMSSMFGGIQVTTLDVSNFDTSNVTGMSSMFGGIQVTTLDLSNFDTSNVTNMAQMFQNSKVTTIDLSNFDTSKVTNMFQMFTHSQATTLDVSSFDTNNVTNMYGMFYDSKATTLDLSSFNTSNVTNMSSMFYDSQATTLDLSNFDTSKVRNMSYMFNNSQATTLNVSKFDTSKVTDMHYMFWNSKATTLDVSNFDTSNVTNMAQMFQNSKVTTIDLSNFDTSKVTDMRYMFYYATNLKTIYTSDKFNIDNVTSSTNMFTGSTNLVGGAGTKYNSSYVDKTYARIDGGTSSPGYFTSIPEPNSFSTDSWMTIAKAVKSGNISKYNVGDTKSVTLTTYRKHTLRIANTSTPDECKTEGFSQTACGFVLEFTDILTTYNMNPSGTYKGTQYDYGWNKDGWPASKMRTFVNSNIYNALPSELRDIIIDTTVISSYGKEDTANFTSTDKIYLLAPKEIYANADSYSSDTTLNSTRQLDYYKSKDTSVNGCSPAIKERSSTATEWWLRNANISTDSNFENVTTWGADDYMPAKNAYGVSPAFRIG